MTRALGDGGREWHLFPKYQREWVEESFFHKVDCCGGKCEVSKVYRAMFAVLRDAAPYPDEALVFEVVCDCVWEGEHVELTDFEDDGGVVAVHVGGAIHNRVLLGWYKLRPLTIAAHEALAMFGGTP